MSKGGSQTTAPDAQSQAYINQMRSAAQAAGNSPAPGVNPLSTQAGNFYGNTMRGGQLGFSALSGDQGAISSFMNPYTHNVMDANNAAWGQINAQTANQVDANATNQNAFGGSRAAIAKASALSQNNIAQGQQNAGLLQGGYNDAMSRAGQMAQLGFAGAGGAAQMGDYMRNVAIQSDPNVWRMNMLNQGMGPVGQTTTQQNGRNPLSGAAGGAAIGGMFGPWGAGIGAAAGGLMSMF